METLHLYRRTSHKYRDGWQHLDSSEYVATARLTPAKMVEEPRDFDEGGTYIMHATIPTTSRKHRESIIRALHDTLGGSECRHEYDCCGCASRYVKATPSGKRHRYVVKMSVTYNY